MIKGLFRKTVIGSKIHGSCQWLWDGKATSKSLNLSLKISNCRTKHSPVNLRIVWMGEYTSSRLIQLGLCVVFSHSFKCECGVSYGTSNVILICGEKTVNEGGGWSNAEANFRCPFIKCLFIMLVRRKFQIFFENK